MFESGAHTPIPHSETFKLRRVCNASRIRDYSRGPSQFLGGIGDTKHLAETRNSVLIGADRNSFLDESSEKGGGRRKKERKEEGKELNWKLLSRDFPSGPRTIDAKVVVHSRISSQVEEDAHRRNE